MLGWVWGWERVGETTEDSPRITVQWTPYHIRRLVMADTRVFIPHSLTNTRSMWDRHLWGHLPFSNQASWTLGSTDGLWEVRYPPESIGKLPCVCVHLIVSKHRFSILCQIFQGPWFHNALESQYSATKAQRTLKRSAKWTKAKWMPKTERCRKNLQILGLSHTNSNNSSKYCWMPKMEIHWLWATGLLQSGCRGGHIPQVKIKGATPTKWGSNSWQGGTALENSRICEKN